MNTQVSIQIDEQTFQDAEMYAREHEKTLNELLTEYVHALAKIQRSGGFSPIIEQMIGVVRDPGGISEDDARWDYLRNKYLGK